MGQGLLVGEEQLGRFLGRGWLCEVGARRIEFRVGKPSGKQGRDQEASGADIGTQEKCGNPACFILLDYLLLFVDRLRTYRAGCVYVVRLPESGLKFTDNDNYLVASSMRSHDIPRYDMVAT